MSITRISVTIPRRLLAQLDRKAAELDRSRSWAVGEAVRRFVEQVRTEGSRGEEQRAVREPGASDTTSPGLGEQRLYQLTSDLALTPAQRVRAAAATARLGRRKTGGPARILQFDRYEDYLDWQRGEGLLT